MKSILTIAFLFFATTLVAQSDPDIRPALQGYSVTGSNTQMSIHVGLENPVTDLYGIAFKARLFEGASVDYFFRPGFSIGDEWRECESYFDEFSNETYTYCQDEFIYFATISEDGKTIDVGISKVDGTPMSGSFELALINLEVNDAGQHVMELFDVSAQDVNGDPIPMIRHAETFQTYQIPDAPVLVSPISSPVRIARDFLFEWENQQAETYDVEFYDPGQPVPFRTFTVDLVHYIGLNLNEVLGKTVHWRVRANFAYGSTVWSPLGYFVVEESRPTGFVDGFSQFDAIPPNLFPVVKVVTGFGMGAALFSDGSIQAWGADVLSAGYLNIPPDLPPLKDLWAGWNHFVGQDSTGALHLWGHFGNEEVVGDPGLTDVVMVAPGLDHNVFLLADGTVQVKGFDAHGLLNVPAGLDSVVSVASGPYHILALTASGHVVSWGRNLIGETDVPTDLDRVVAMAANNARSIVLREDGTVRMWPAPEELPSDVVNGTTVALSAGVEGAAALLADGTIRVWGFSDLTPFQTVLQFADIVAISVSSGGPVDQQIIVIRSSDFVPSIAVWPGEVNSDDVVSAADILNIGLFYGQTGTSNQPGSLWQPYLRQQWPSDGATPRRIYADANGDGIIDESDVPVLGFNYGNVVGVMSKPRPSLVQEAESITMNAELTRNDAGERVLRIRMDQSSYLYGISMRISLDKDQLNPSLSVKEADMDHPIRFQKWLPQQKKIAIAMSRTDRQDIPVQGTLLDIKLNASLSADQIVFEQVIGFLSDGRQVDVTMVLDPVVTSLDDDLQLPERTALLQNYPNPFNPTTAIRWSLAASSSVKIRVVDMLGREVGTVVSDDYAAGTHAATLDAGVLNLSSGTYVVVMDVREIQSGNVSRHTSKMVLIK